MACHQVPMNPADEEKTAFSTPRGGLYQYVTMPFGLCNAGATFQRINETVMRGLHWHVLVLYLDDIIEFSETFDEHLVNLQKVFQRLSDAGLKLKAAKCSFLNTRRFIKDFSKIAKCLFDLLQLKALWQWTSDCEQTFRLLKEKLSSSPVRAYPEIDDEEFILDPMRVILELEEFCLKFRKDKKE
ncbi:unnamed protein product [Mytilus coruscus]|uniref:Reverse transcriptase domain-containing protein n=1 Tax=Mytilus coruscus TaxID=42192 RepID=A0A6J8AAT6_MYTCO|nr:unnamed protein product [Mytilus coruscus]